MTRVRTWWNAYWFSPAPLIDLAVCRVLFVGFQLAWLLSPQGLQRFRQHAALPDALYDPLPMLHLFLLPFGWSSRPSSEVLEALYWLTVAAGIVALVGAKTRLSLALFTLGHLFLSAFQYSIGRVVHNDGLMMLALGCLALSPSGAMLSFDSTQRRQRQWSDTDPFAGWPLKLLRWLFALAYLSSALSKLQAAGLDWVNGSTLQYYLFDTGLHKGRAIGVWLSQQHTTTVVLSWLTLLFEGTFFLVVMFPRLARVYLPLGTLFHLGTSLAMGVDFYQFIVLYAVFIPWRTVLKALARYLESVLAKVRFVAQST